MDRRPIGGEPLLPWPSACLPAPGQIGTGGAPRRPRPTDKPTDQARRPGEDSRQSTRGHGPATGRRRSGGHEQPGRVAAAAPLRSASTTTRSATCWSPAVCDSGRRLPHPAAARRLLPWAAQSRPRPERRRFLSAAGPNSGIRADQRRSCPVAAAIAGDTASGCLREEVHQRFGRRAFRRPLGTDEVNDLPPSTAHRAGDINYPFRRHPRGGVGHADLALLPLPGRGANVPPVTEQGLVRFNADELASRLSYTLWGIDAGRRALHRGGRRPPEHARPDRGPGPADAEGRPRRATPSPTSTCSGCTSTGCPRSRPKDARFTAYTPAAGDGDAERDGHLRQRVFASDGSLEQLLTRRRPRSIRRWPSSTAPAADGPISTQRAGVLTQASFLAMHANATDTEPGPPGRRGAAAPAAATTSSRR